MAKKISIDSDASQEELEKVVEGMELEEPQDHSVRQFFDDVMDGKLSDTWKDMENIVTDIFNSRSLARVYIRRRDRLSEAEELLKRALALETRPDHVKWIKGQLEALHADILP